jgi:hypothetical protein
VSENHAVQASTDHGRFIRLGGSAILAGFLIHIVANGVLKKFPPDDPTLDELKAYLSEEASTWALVHGLRYVAFVCIALFAAALFMRTCRAWGTRSTGWGVVGLLGAAFHVTSGVITNGIEILAFMDFHRLSDDPKLFWLVFYLTRVLFTGEIVAWGLLIGGFSAAGWQSSTLPRWLTILGILSAIGTLACGVFIVSILRDGSAAGFLVEIASIGCLAWFLITGVLMVVQGAAASKDDAV